MNHVVEPLQVANLSLGFLVKLRRKVEHVLDWSERHEISLALDWRLDLALINAQIARMTPVA